MRQRKWALFAGVSVVGLAADQLSKLWVRANLDRGYDGISVIDGFFELVHVENTGAAFGFLSGYSWSMFVFIPFTLIAVAMLVSLMRDLPADSRVMPVTLGLINAGAFGNFVDRVLYQSVTDFLRFYLDSGALSDFIYEQVGTREYPSFNVADICICVGVAMFVVFELINWKRSRGPAPEPAAGQA